MIPFGHAPVLKLYHDLEARFLHCSPRWATVARWNGWQHSVAIAWLEKGGKRPAFMRRFR